jgi:hypothetical protein
MAGRDPVQVRLLRTWDLIDLRLEAVNCSIEPGDGGAHLVAGADAVLVLHFPPQHIGEQTWPAGDGTVAPVKPNHASKHRAADPSRVAYDVPEGTRIAWTLPDVLKAVTDLRLRVAENATPAREAHDRVDSRPPDELETAIEAPYRLVVSPSDRATFTHREKPYGPAHRPELWRTTLGVRPDQQRPDDPVDQHIVRALWARDEPEVLDSFGLDAPIIADQRLALVEQTNGGQLRNADTPLEVATLQLSSLGAWFDWKQSWVPPRAIVDYRHQAFMGRDGYVRVVTPGLLFPFGHECYLVHISEREIKDRDDPVAYLWSRYYIVLRQPTRTYPGRDRDNPFAQVTLSPLVTPDLETPPGAHLKPFVPRRAGKPFDFTLTTIDRAGDVRSWSAPLVYMPIVEREGRFLLPPPADVKVLYQPVRVIPGRGQTLSVAQPVKTGDTSVEAVHLIFDGEIDQQERTSRPFLTEMRGVVPAMRHLSPQAPQVDLEFAKPYLLHGLPDRVPDAPTIPGVPNTGELLLALKGAAAAIDFSSGTDRSGGFVAPNVTVRGISRALGAIGESGDLPSPKFDAGQFDPASFLAGALPKLFGLFSLLELIPDDVVQALDKAPAFVTDALEAVAKMEAEATRLKKALDEATNRLADEVAKGAHDGAKKVADDARKALELEASKLHAHLDALLTALSDLVTDPGEVSATAVSAAAVELAKDLDPLLTAIGLPGVPAAVRAGLDKPIQALKTLTDMAKTVDDVRKQLESLASAQITARLHWQPVIGPWPSQPNPPAPPVNPANVFAPHGHFAIDVEVRASAKAPPAVDIVAEITDFDLNLVGDGATGLMQLQFRRIGFHAASTGKPQVDVVFGGIKFLGPLAFVDRLRELVPFDGFADPPYVDVAADGVKAGFDVTLPNVSVGVFSLENISLGADARVPFLGDAMSVGFHFCSKDAPFRLTVMCIGGGGWLVLRAAPKGLVLLELGLEAAACLSVDLGVASGSVSIAVGVYLRLEADTGLLTAYFRIRGEVDVLGLISASITLELSLAYQFDTGKLIGKASLVVEVEVLFFSASVEIVVERRLAGSKGDPTMKQVMPPDPTGMNSDWAAYCDAFAPVGA